MPYRDELNQSKHNGVGRWRTASRKTGSHGYRESVRKVTDQTIMEILDFRAHWD